MLVCLVRPLAADGMVRAKHVCLIQGSTEADEPPVLGELVNELPYSSCLQLSKIPLSLTAHVDPQVLVKVVL